MAKSHLTCYGFDEAKRLRQSQALSVVSGTYLRRQNSTNYFKLNGRMISHDGEHFNYGFVDIEIDEFDGARKITSLKAYPIDMTQIQISFATI
ncbi:hypothetical protein BCON_0195g00300 [Botryotinia convoluta]|uniref:DUF7025 domain-containing protein n=1 Tax=Botryotinia convoluta TaxID=54673 RepID=A0A4Z1HRW7_9HELO|nr:hypothetical protein BCON_0195g00300 [Botryotinia convoluta]